ncbi:MAG: RsmB/NOP family class I SAM-dependent RNA methyltransferase [bacterium]
MDLPDAIRRFRDLADDWDAFVAALQRPVPTDLRFNPLATDRPRFEEALASEGLRWERMPASPDLYRVRGMDAPGLTWMYHMGWYHPQGYTSTLPPVVLEPSPGSTVLDLCAAPGGKTSQLAAIMGGEGIVVANDVRIDRIAGLTANLERLAVPNALITTYPGQNYPERFGFDHVLADVPCTAEGTYRMEDGTYRPDPHGSPEAAGRALQPVQVRLLDKALRVVRPGGSVLYSTCTYAPEQDEVVVAEVLEALPGSMEVEIESLPDAVGGTPGLRGWKGRELPAALQRTRRLWPHHTDSWGFYLALLRRRR